MSKCPHYWGEHRFGCSLDDGHTGPHEFAPVFRERIRRLEAAVKHLLAGDFTDEQYADFSKLVASPSKGDE
jgi:hypothetical protein